MSYTPKYMTALAAGLDLPAAEFGVLPVGGSVVVDTGIKLQDLLIEAGHDLGSRPAMPSLDYIIEAQVRPRSGLAAKHGVMAMLGTIDLDYKDTIKVILFNFGKEKYEIHPGDRVAQLVFGLVYRPVHLLTSTERTGGLGSTDEVKDVKPKDAEN